MWIPGYTKIDLGPDGGPYDETRHPKGGLHTTEGSTLAGAESAFKAYPPHLGYDPLRRIKHQYVALNRYSYAYRGSESDDEFIIQVEMVGFARQTHLWSDEAYRNIAEDVIKPLEDLVGIPRSYLRFYGEGEGIILASPTSPIRLTASQLRNYSGWLGHQHIPAPDFHWDPGKFLIAKCFRHLDSLVVTPREGQMKDLILAQEAGGVKTWVGDGVVRRHVADPTELEGIQYWIGQKGGDPVVQTGFQDLRVLGVDIAELVGQAVTDYFDEHPPTVTVDVDNAAIAQAVVAEFKKEGN